MPYTTPVCRVLLARIMFLALARIDQGERRADPSAQVIIASIQSLSKRKDIVLGRIISIRWSWQASGDGGFYVLIAAPRTIPTSPVCSR
jgi:hypothetical protein